MLLALLVVQGTGIPQAVAGTVAGSSSRPEPGLSAALLQTVRDLHFEEVLDYQTGRQISGMPSIDLAVIELTATGEPRAAANVLFSRAYPDGMVVDVEELRATGVRWHLWEQERWDETPANRGDTVRRSGRVEFMSPFPASILKLMVGFGVLRLVDRGEIELEAVSTDLDAMITQSDNVAAIRLIALLHHQDAIAELNATFVRLGLGTLQLSGTDPDGGTWTGVRMTALDTARLLLIISGAPGVLWRTPDGRAVSDGVLSSESRRLLYRLLSQQGLNHAMSTTNFCGRAYPPPGIPQRAADRWMNDAGEVTVGDHRYGRNVEPCNADAEVTYAHKTGWTTNAGGDAGIVHALPGKPARDYIVVLLSNLGARFGDARRPATPSGHYPFPYTEKVPELGRAIDDVMTTRRGRLTLRAEIL